MWNVLLCSILMNSGKSKTSNEYNLMPTIWDKTDLN